VTHDQIAAHYAEKAQNNIDLALGNTVVITDPGIAVGLAQANASLAVYHAVMALYTGTFNR
jgi:hypothetical protein